MKRIRVCVFVSLLAISSAGLAAETGDAFLLNTQAFDGITFNDLFVDPERTDAGQQPAAKNLLIFIKQMTTNIGELAGYADVDAATKALCEEALVYLKPVQAYLTEPAGAALAKTSLCDFFVKKPWETDGRLKQMLDDIQTKTVLFLPFYGYVKQNELAKLIEDPAFLENYGEWSYIDFFQTPKFHPMVSDEMRSLVDTMNEIGLFGRLHLDFGKRGTAEGALRLLPRELLERIRGNNMCCDRNTKKCVSREGYTCPVCNTMTGACCLVAQWCPAQ